MRRYIIVAAVAAAAVASTAPAFAQNRVQEGGRTLVAQERETETVEYGTRLRVNVRRSAFLGTVLSEFAEQDDASEDRPGCIEGRTVQLFLQRKSGGFKRVGSDLTDEDGRWKIRTDIRAKSVYVTKVMPHDFVYSPSYGRLEQAICIADQVRLRPARVLGIRVTRGGGEAEAGAQGRAGPAALPRTGLDGQGWLAVGLLLMGSGELLRRFSSPSRRCPLGCRSGHGR